MSRTQRLQQCPSPAPPAAARTPAWIAPYLVFCLHFCLSPVQSHLDSLRDYGSVVPVFLCSAEPQPEWNQSLPGVGTCTAWPRPSVPSPTRMSLHGGPEPLSALRALQAWPHLGYSSSNSPYQGAFPHQPQAHLPTSFRPSITSSRRPPTKGHIKSQPHPIPSPSSLHPSELSPPSDHVTLVSFMVCLLPLEERYFHACPHTEDSVRTW